MSRSNAWNRIKTSCRIAFKPLHRPRPPLSYCQKQMCLLSLRLTSSLKWKWQTSGKCINIINTAVDAYVINMSCTLQMNTCPVLRRPELFCLYFCDICLLYSAVDILCYNRHYLCLLVPAFWSNRMASTQILGYVTTW